MSTNQVFGANSLYPLDKYKLCDDSLFYPGCCAEHDRISLASKISFTSKADTTSISNGFSPSKYSDIPNNNLSPTRQPQYSDYSHFERTRYSDDKYYITNPCQDKRDSRISFSPTKQTPNTITNAEVDKRLRYKNFLSTVSPDSDNYSVSTCSVTSPDDDDYFARSSSHLTDDSSHVNEVTSVSGFHFQATRDQQIANDDVTSTCSSDDTVYESDAIASSCCTPTCDDLSTETCDVPDRRNYRSTTPPSRNVTPVAKEDSTKQIHPTASKHLEVADIVTAFGRDIKTTSLHRRNVVKGLSLSSKLRMPTASMDFDLQSVSTLSGSGMDFFRKFVQRKGRLSDGTSSMERSKMLTKGCKDCESQFRRDVLIDRLVSDSLQNKPWKAEEEKRKRRQGGETQEKTEDRSEDVMSPSATEASYSSVRCKIHEESGYRFLGSVENVDKREEDVGSVRTSISHSTVSGSGLLFLRNYLRKKNANLKNSSKPDDDLEVNGSNHQQQLTKIFNSVPVPFPPRDDFYGPLYIPDELVFHRGGPASRRPSSVGSTIADLLNETFDSEDSELRNLDWEEWEEDIHYDITEEDFAECDLSQMGNDELSNNVSRHSEDSVVDVGGIEMTGTDVYGPVYGCRYTAQQFATEIQNYVDASSEIGQSRNSDTEALEKSGADQHYGYYDDDDANELDQERSQSVYENVSKHSELSFAVENVVDAKADLDSRCSSGMSFALNDEGQFQHRDLADPCFANVANEDSDDKFCNHDECSKREAVRCLSAAICRYTNKHSSDLPRSQNGSDELMRRVGSRASKLSVGRGSGSRCSSRCSRETCLRNQNSKTKFSNSDNDRAVYRQNVTSSTSAKSSTSISSPLTPSQSTSFSSPVMSPMIHHSSAFNHVQMRELVSITGDEKRMSSPIKLTSPLVHHTSAFHHVLTRDNNHYSVTCDEKRDEVMTSKENKNRMADFWEKSIQAATQAEPEVPVPVEVMKQQHTYIRSISDDQQKSGFRLALPAHYDPAAHSNVTDRVQQFLAATRRAADNQNNKIDIVSRRSSVGDSMSAMIDFSAPLCRTTLRQNAGDIRLRKTKKHYSTNSIADSFS